jgi:cytochrome d ubiquinol oxidase subunit II
MSLLGFIVIAFMLAAYVVLDGYDLGVGAVSWLIARSDRERAAAMDAIGPFWNGNEVWLVAAGAALFALFPAAYAASFSGFYLPFMVVLWLLMIRGVAIELRGHFPSDLWHTFWDVAFSGASVLLIAVFGVALGNLVRGLPLGADQTFQGSFSLLFNPYALAVGALAVAALMLHGALFLALRIEGTLAVRARQAARTLWWIVVVLFAIGTVATLWGLGRMPAHHLIAAALLAIALVAMLAIHVGARGEAIVATFGASCVFLIALLAAAASTMYPFLVPAYPAGAGGISVDDATPSRLALACALAVTIGGSIAVLAYGSFVWRRMAGKIRVE